jgi:hypothetical protein
MSTIKPKFSKNRHAMKTRMKCNIDESLLQGNNRSYCIGCTVVAETESDEDNCIMNSIHKGLFQHLSVQDKSQDGGIKKITPRQYRYIAYKYCTTSIHGKLGWRKRCPLPICVEIYIKNWFAEREYPYNFAGFAEASSECLVEVEMV